MHLQPVKNRVLPHREFLAAGLAFQISNLLLLSMTAVSNQGMDTLIRDPVIFATWIGAKVSLGRLSLLRPSSSLPQTPGLWYSWLKQFAFSFLVHAKQAIPLAFGLHHVRFAGLCCAFLFLEERPDPIPPQKTIKFKTQDQNSQDYQ